jgi:hypothetical protein
LDLDLETINGRSNKHAIAIAIDSQFRWEDGTERKFEWLEMLVASKRDSDRVVALQSVSGDAVVSAVKSILLQVTICGREHRVQQDS